jgi:Bacterial regulatory helix-turn-helix protein, lysR family
LLVLLSGNAEESSRLTGAVAKTVNSIRSNHNCLPSPARDPFLQTILHGAEFNFSVKDVRSFLVVLEEDSLNRVALRLHLAQSSLTRQMQALEHEIGGALLERMAIGVAPTAAGMRSPHRMRPVLAEFEAAVSEARRFARGQNAQIRAGYMRAAATLLNPALAVLRQTHPGVKVQLFDLTQGEQSRPCDAATSTSVSLDKEAAVLTHDSTGGESRGYPWLSLCRRITGWPGRGRSG